MRNIIILLFAIVSVACAQNKEVVTTDEGQHFGEMMDGSGAITYDELLAQLESKDEVDGVKVIGKVEGVCQSIGCWMNIVSETEGAEPMFVKFKDYGFFMPKDIAGETVILRGKAYKEETSVDELRHYAEDNGDSKEVIEAITEPKVELKFMADAVILK
ncbi:DUF4920 domain-containing protein [Portibacter lacus]|uniref:DUF4920 domain-containing protein n=1 Tax=Portibacter lacus TaxID=1099794 RepID=A0AA37SU87_9BACT|nr:DUF4920 domain-containing protein [Portibacter lacus]GLR19764.1 hypothetical protein GCM10007940_43800 [Portibacter lacus]